MKLDKKNYIIVLFLPIFLIICVVSMFGCQKDDTADLGQIENLELIKKDTLTVGIAPGFAPFEVYNNGELEGIDIDIIQTIAKDLHLNVEYKTIKYNNLLDAVINNEIDVAISAISVTLDNKKFATLSKPYYTDEKVIAVKKGSQITESSVDSLLQNPKTKVGYRSYSTVEDYVNANYKNVNKKSYNKFHDVSKALEDNDCDVAFLYKSYLDAFPEKNIQYVKTVGEKDECAIALNKTSNELYKIINKDISLRLNDGTISKIINKWIYA